MTGLTTTNALMKFQKSIKQSLDCKPKYLTSAFLSWYGILGMLLLFCWIVTCGIFLKRYPLVLMLTTLCFLLTLMLLLSDTWLSHREKLNIVHSILDILKTYNADIVQSVTPGCYISSGNKLGNFYLNESFPSSSSVSVVHVYRNGKVVVVGRTMLVEGDVIVINPGQQAPANCISLDGKTTLKRGDMYPEKKEESPSSIGGKNCVIVSPRHPLLFTVTNTDYKDNLIQFLQHTKPLSKLRTELAYMLKVIHTRTIPLIMVLSVTLGVVQYMFLSSGTELEACLVTALPLLPLTYPIYYSIVHHIATARIILTAHKSRDTLDPMKTPDDTQQNRKHNRLGLKAVLRTTYDLIIGRAYRYLPRNSNIFDTLSVMTVLCTVNKEGILSHPNPNVERLMLLDPDIKDTSPKTPSKTELEGVIEESDKTEETESLPTEVGDICQRDDINLSHGISNDLSGHVPNDPCEKAEGETCRLLLDTHCSVGHLAGLGDEEIIVQTKHGSLPNLPQSKKDDVVIPQLRSLIVDNKFSLLGTRRMSRISASDIEITSPTRHINRLSKMWISTTKKVSKSKRESFTPVDTPDDSGAESETPKTKKKRKNFWQLMIKQKYKALPETEPDEGRVSDGSDHVEEESKSASESERSKSLKDDYVVVLNISLCKQSPLGLSFDRADLDQLRDSLKPVGLAVLLNNLCRIADINAGVTSHLHHISVQTYCGLTFKLPLPIDYCNCVLGREIGFTHAAVQQYDKLSNVVTYVPPASEQMKCSLRNPADNMSPLTCIVSSVIRDKLTAKRHMFSYGTAALMMKFCYNYWSGQELKVLQPEHVTRVLEFYNQNRLTSHCFVLAYRPLLEQESFPLNNIFLSLPKGHGFLDEPAENELDPAEDLLKLQCGQTFLGVACAQFQPKHDIVRIVEILNSANIRFVQFSYDNELRSRAFGTKLGFETGWNCHISLAEGEYDNFSIDSSNGDDPQYYYYTDNARLPQGIKNIRPHLEKVDNVPLLVPLFTSCTPPAIEEMIKIMQENNEIVCCMGSSLQFDNFQLFLQADSSIGIVPLLPQQCLISGIKDLTLPWISDNYFSPPQQKEFAAPNCLHLSSVLNTVPCSLVMARNNVTVQPIIRTAREMLVSLKQSGYLALSMYSALSVYCLVHQLLLLPPPLSVSLCLYVCVFLIPTLATTPFTLQTDRKIMELHTGKKHPILADMSRHCKYYVIRWSCLFLLGPANTALNLRSTCNSDNCTFVLGDRSPESGRFSSEAVSLTQHYNILILATLYCTFSFGLAHRTKSLNKQYYLKYFTKFTAVIPILCIVVTVLFVTCSLGGILLKVDKIPVVSLCLILTLPALQFGLCELTKTYDRRLFTRYQRRQKLQFGTKLGMNSPF